MGLDASYQAIPEDCELFICAHNDGEYVELLIALHRYARYGSVRLERTQYGADYLKAIQELVRQHPGLIDRYFDPASRAWDAIIYLLSEPDYARQMNERSLIEQAIRGNEPLHPSDTQIRFVSASTVQVISDYLEAITREQLHARYDPPNMQVYKVFPDDGEERFEDIWQEFVGVRNVYRAAAQHGEAMIVSIS